MDSSQISLVGGKPTETVGIRYKVHLLFRFDKLMWHGHLRVRVRQPLFPLNSNVPPDAKGKPDFVSSDVQGAKLDWLVGCDRPLG